MDDLLVWGEALATGLLLDGHVPTVLFGQVAAIPADSGDQA
ncbi:MAG: hypothetical protein ACK5O2_06720 [Microthrixaceae bacterium]